MGRARNAGVFARVPETGGMNARLSRRGFVILASAAALAGCAAPKTRWAHPKLPAENWPADIAACRKKARRLAYDGALDEMVLTSEALETGVLTPVDRAALERSRKGDVKQLTARCLRARGYIPEKTR